MLNKSIKKYIHTYVYIHTYILSYVYIYTYKHTYIHTYVYIHTYIHTYVYIYTYIHTHIHVCINLELYRTEFKKSLNHVSCKTFQLEPNYDLRRDKPADTKTDMNKLESAFHSLPDMSD